MSRLNKTIESEKELMYFSDLSLLEGYILEAYKKDPENKKLRDMSLALGGIRSFVYGLQIDLYVANKIISEYEHNRNKLILERNENY